MCILESIPATYTAAACTIHAWRLIVASTGRKIQSLSRDFIPQNSERRIDEEVRLFHLAVKGLVLE